MAKQNNSSKKGRASKPLDGSANRRAHDKIVKNNTDSTGPRRPSDASKNRNPKK